MSREEVSSPPGSQGPVESQSRGAPYGASRFARGGPLEGRRVGSIPTSSTFSVATCQGFLAREHFPDATRRLQIAVGFVKLIIPAELSQIRGFCLESPA